MSTDRKKKLKQKAEKAAKAQAHKRAMLNRMFAVMGLKKIADQFPEQIYRMFLRYIGPPIEIVVSDDSPDTPLMKDLAHQIRRIVPRVFKEEHENISFELSIEDMFRCYFTILREIPILIKLCAMKPPANARVVRGLLEEANRIVKCEQQGDWTTSAMSLVGCKFVHIADQCYSLDGQMLDLKLVGRPEPGAPYCEQIHLRLRTAEPYVVNYKGSRWTTFAGLVNDCPDGMHHATWNCKALGIEGPSTNLPVYIEKHAFARLRERLPFIKDEAWLHRCVGYSLDKPVLHPHKEYFHHFVEFVFDEDRLGYFVAQILPHLVLVKTFLFLTMDGTPEARLLHEKLGLDRADIEYYKLDHFYSIVGSDIQNDPFLSRVLSQCGCGHLLSWNSEDVGDRIPWLDRFGERLKKTFALREAEEGFKVGNKWVRWSDTPENAGRNDEGA
ncbi:MAG: hypothetical protein NVSMB9_34310 [Isosphaeraceae bacterium]